MRACDADVGTHSVSQVYNLCPLNSPTSIKFTYLLLIYQH